MPPTKITPTLPPAPTHSLLLWRPLSFFTPTLCCRGVLLSSHSYSATLFPYSWVDWLCNEHKKEGKKMTAEEVEEAEEEEEAPCLAPARLIRFPIKLGSWSDLARVPSATDGIIFPIISLRHECLCCAMQRYNSLWLWSGRRHILISVRPIARSSLHQNRYWISFVKHMNIFI